MARGVPDGTNPVMIRRMLQNLDKSLNSGISITNSRTVITDTILKANDHTVFIDPSGNAISSTLPLANTVKNQSFITMNIASDDLFEALVNVIDDKLINGFEGVLLTKKSSITLKSDGTSWHIISSTKDIDLIVFISFFQFADQENFLFADGEQFVTLEQG